LVVDRFARLEPNGAVPVVDLAELSYLGEDPLEIARAHHLGLREPVVVADAEHRGHAFGLAEDPFHAHGCEPLRLLLERELHPFVALARLDAGSDVLHVLRRVRVRGYFDRLAVQLPVADRDRAAERVELRPGVLDVVLALDRRARELKDRRENVSKRPAARVRDGQGPWWIRGDGLQLEP